MNHVDMSAFIAPKSDQLNADDLISGPRTITVSGVSASPDAAEQPVSIHFEGDGGKPFKPCKSMRRVMVSVWGSDAQKYAGRSMTIYRDPDVTFGGMKVGGIRISHMTGLDEPKTLALTATRAKRKPFTVKPLTVEAAEDGLGKAIGGIIVNIGKAPDAAKLDQYLAGKPKTAIDDARENRPELYAEFETALAAKRATFSGGDEDDPFGEPDLAEQLTNKIAAANTEQELNAAATEYEERRGDLADDDVAAAIDAKIAARRRALVS